MTIRGLSTSPLLMDIITTRKAAIKTSVMGITDVLISSTLEAVEPTAPNRKAYIKKPSTKNRSI